MFPLARTVPLMGEGVRGLTVAVVRVAVEIIPNDGDFGSWLMPEEERRERGRGQREMERERERERDLNVIIYIRICIPVTISKKA